MLPSGVINHHKSAVAKPHLSVATSIVNEFHARLLISHIRDVMENGVGDFKAL